MEKDAFTSGNEADVEGDIWLLFSSQHGKWKGKASFWKRLDRQKKPQIDQELSCVPASMGQPGPGPQTKA